MKKRYGLIIDSGKPIYFEDQKSRKKITDNIKNKYTYSTFTKEILNPNCSEVVARLPVKNITEGKKLLKSIGLDIVRHDPYIHMHKISEKYNRIIDPENPNSPDFEHRAYLNLSKGNYEHGDGVYVVGHQHSQHQIFKTIEKIQSELNVEFFGYDGGYNFEECFNDWLDKETDVPDHQDDIRAEIEILLKQKKIQQTIEGVFLAVDITTNKKYSDKQKYDYLAKTVDEIVEDRKEELIAKRRKESKEIHDRIQKETGMKHKMRRESDQEIFDHLKQFYHFQYTESLFNCIEYKQIRKSFLGRDNILPNKK